MARQYKNLNHINVDHMALVRTDKRERRGKVGSISKSNKAILKMMVANKGIMPRCKKTGQWISPNEE
tara:strand:- start:696 stop:896 length:201 start_codon:yes stop_codon:yes gene_type:complete